MNSLHKGSCHCGRITFELYGELTVAVDCNCSLCHRKGALWHATDDAHLRILSGESDLSLYQFHTMTAKHYFCSYCGISVFSRPRIAPAKWVVNLRSVHDVDLSKLEILPFDGQCWEEAAKQYLQKRSASAV